MKRLLGFAVILFIPGAAFSEDAKNLLKPIDKESSWRFELHGGAQGALEIVDKTAVLKAEKLTGTNWHVQAFQVNLDLKDGQEYTLKVTMSAPRSRSVLIVATIDEEDWHEIGLHEDVRLGKEPKTYEFTFKADGVVANKNRIGFVLGDETGDVVIKDMTLTEKKKS